MICFPHTQMSVRVTALEVNLSQRRGMAWIEMCFLNVPLEFVWICQLFRQFAQIYKTPTDSYTG